MIEKLSSRELRRVAAMAGAANLRAIDAWLSSRLWIHPAFPSVLVVKRGVCVPLGQRPLRSVDRGAHDPIDPRLCSRLDPPAPAQRQQLLADNITARVSVCDVLGQPPLDQLLQLHAHDPPNPPRRKFRVRQETDQTITTCTLPPSSGAPEYHASSTSNRRFGTLGRAWRGDSSIDAMSPAAPRARSGASPSAATHRASGSTLSDFPEIRTTPRRSDHAPVPEPVLARPVDEDRASSRSSSGSHASGNAPQKIAGVSRAHLTASKAFPHDPQGHQHTRGPGNPGATHPAEHAHGKGGQPGLCSDVKEVRSAALRPKPATSRAVEADTSRFGNGSHRRCRNVQGTGSRASALVTPTDGHGASTQIVQRGIDVRKTQQFKEEHDVHCNPRWVRPPTRAPRHGEPHRRCR